jgi:hypothetical protein
MIGHDDLLPRNLIPPLLMAIGCSGKQEAVALEYRDHLIRG